MKNVLTKTTTPRVSFSPPRRPGRFLPGLPVLALCTVLAAACSGGGIGGSPPSSAKKITAFSLAGFEGVIEGTRISVKGIPLYADEGKTTVTDLTDLSPVIHHNGVDLSPGSGTGTDFSGLVKTFIVTAEDGTTAEYTVVVDLEPLDTSGGIAGAVGSYIAAVPAAYSGTAVGTPIPLPVRIDFPAEWTPLLTAIRTADKYVALDLSACAMTGTFDPDNTTSTGKDKIVSLVLPDGAGRITASQMGDSTFEHFSALKSVSGAGIVTVGEYAFSGCDTLQTVHFPAATSFSKHAFRACTAVQTFSFPAATTIGTLAFAGCTGVRTFKLPAAKTIGQGAFTYCAALRTLELPAATIIGDSAFFDCTALQTLSLPAVTSIGIDAFGLTGAQALTIALPRTPPVVAETGTDSDLSFTKNVTVKAPVGRINYDYVWTRDFMKAFGLSNGDKIVSINLTVTGL
jgi:hypothetical protein